MHYNTDSWAAGNVKFVSFEARIVRNIRTTNSHMTNVDIVELNIVIIALVEFTMFITIYVLHVEKIITNKGRGSDRIPIETDIEFQRAFSASFDRLPYDSPPEQRVSKGLS
jgi:hypothetical protein